MNYIFKDFIIQISSVVVCGLSLSMSNAQQVFDTLITTHRVIVLFGSDQHYVKSEFQDSLLKIVELASNQDAFQIQLNAHTDDIGSPEYNEVLALKRMKSVESFFASSDINKDNINSLSHGERLPLFKILNERNRSLSRRVEVDLQVYKKVKKILTKVVDVNTDENVLASVTVNSFGLENNYLTDENGEIDVLYPFDENIQIESRAENYLFKYLNLKPNIIKRLDTIKIRMTSINLDSKFSLNELNFRSNKCILIPTSLSALTNLDEFMRINSDICIEISGHINLPNQAPVDTTHHYFDLSESRANVIYDSLRVFGIDKYRMYTKGYGNWEMKFPKAKSDIEQAQNRRVEVSIKDCDYVKNQHNAIVDIPELHGYVKAFKRYDPRTIDSDLLGVNTAYKERIKNIAAEMLKNGKDPEVFSYADLIKSN